MAHAINVDGDDESEGIGESTSLLSSRQQAPLKSLKLSRSRCTWPWTRIVALCITISIIVDIGEQLFMAPKVRLYESIACTAHYLHHNSSLVGNDGFVPEKLCKVNPVQEKVAMILGWQDFFDSIPALLLPVAYGHLADTYGQKWTAVLAFLGYSLASAWKLFVVR
jgi:hypothetical protein